MPLSIWGARPPELAIVVPAGVDAVRFGGDEIDEAIEVDAGGGDGQICGDVEVVSAQEVQHFEPISGVAFFHAQSDCS